MDPLSHGLGRTAWRKARRSASNGGDCVEVAGLPGAVAVRDSKDPHGPALTFSHAHFRAFARRVKAGPS